MVISLKGIVPIHRYTHTPNQLLYPGHQNGRYKCFVASSGPFPLAVRRRGLTDTTLTVAKQTRLLMTDPFTDSTIVLSICTCIFRGCKVASISVHHHSQSARRANRAMCVPTKAPMADGQHILWFSLSSPRTSPVRRSQNVESTRLGGGMGRDGMERLDGMRAAFCSIQHGLGPRSGGSRRRRAWNARRWRRHTDPCHTVVDGRTSPAPNERRRRQL